MCGWEVWLGMYDVGKEVRARLFVPGPACFGQLLVPAKGSKSASLRWFW